MSKRTKITLESMRTYSTSVFAPATGMNQARQVAQCVTFTVDLTFSFSEHRKRTHTLPLVEQPAAMYHRVVHVGQTRQRKAQHGRAATQTNTLVTHLLSIIRRPHERRPVAHGVSVVDNLHRRARSDAPQLRPQRDLLTLRPSAVSSIAVTFSRSPMPQYPHSVSIVDRCG